MRRRPRHVHRALGLIARACGFLAAALVIFAPRLATPAIAAGTDLYLQGFTHLVQPFVDHLMKTLTSNTSATPAGN